MNARKLGDTHVENSEASSTEPERKNPENQNEIAAVTKIISELSTLDTEARERILQTVATFYGIGMRPIQSPRYEHSHAPEAPDRSGGSFSEERSISPKQFMNEKQPNTDVEKVACLAYYLTHYRDTPYFKTLDISKLNTEAAQTKFANATVSVDNATKRNYLVPATKGNKQLSAAGEQFVQALPDREKARAIMESTRSRRRTRKPDVQDDEG